MDYHLDDNCLLDLQIIDRNELCTSINGMYSIRCKRIADHKGKHIADAKASISTWAVEGDLLIWN